jgi:hypothetical protein
VVGHEQRRAVAGQQLRRAQANLDHRPSGLAERDEVVAPDRLLDQDDDPRHEISRHVLQAEAQTYEQRAGRQQHRAHRNAQQHERGQGACDHQEIGEQLAQREDGATGPALPGEAPAQQIADELPGEHESHQHAEGGDPLLPGERP